MSTVQVLSPDRRTEQSLLSMLGAHGYEVQRTGNGTHDWALTDDRIPDAIVHDATADPTGAIEQCRRWKQDPRLYRVPFVCVALTDLADQDRDQMSRAGADAIVTDTDGFPNLLQTLDRHLRQPAGDDQADDARQLFDAVFEGVAIHVEGRIVEANQAMAAMFGCDLDEFIGRHVLDFAAPESRELVRHNAQSGSTQPYEAVGLRQDGTRIHCELRGRAITWQGQPARLTAIRDITQRVLMEKQLRAARAEADSVFEYAPAPMLLLDNHAKVQRANQAADLVAARPPQQLTGLTVGQALGCMHSNGNSMGDQECAGCQLDRIVGNVLERHQATQNTGVALTVRKDGGAEQRRFLVSASPVDANGSPMALLCLQDVTEESRTAAALRESEEKYRTLVEAANDGILIVRDGRIVFLNSWLAEMGGYTVEELMGSNFLDYVHPDDTAEVADRHRRRMAGESVPSTYETRLRRKHGQYVPCEINATRVNYEGAPAALVIVRDIRERYENRAALEAANRKLEQALSEVRQSQSLVVQHQRLRALGAMASGVAHDFNNALSPVVGYCDLLLSRPGDLDDRDRARRYLEAIRQAADDAVSTVKRLREFYRGKDVRRPHTEIDVAKLMAEAKGLTKPRWQVQPLERDVAINLDVDVDPGLRIKGDGGELQEALACLIFNAVDSMPEGGAIILRGRRTTRGVELSVIDNGIGMDAETRRRCLEPFFSTKGGHGTGMGLALVYGVAQRHDGQVEVESQPGEGTTVTLILPPYEEEGAESRAASPLADSAVAAGARRVLVVDDEPMIRELVGELLGAEGREVVLAGSGREAIDRFSPEAFDLVITDRAMPDMNGDQVAARIKEISPSTPVIMLTGFGDQMDSAKDRPAGVDVVISKPVTLQGLNQAIADAMAD